MTDMKHGTRSGKQLMQLITDKVEQKSKNARVVFRRFDEDKSGSVNTCARPLLAAAVVVVVVAVVAVVETGGGGDDELWRGGVGRATQVRMQVQRPALIIE
mgnify:CR=1 FL=1